MLRRLWALAAVMPLWGLVSGCSEEQRGMYRPVPVEGGDLPDIGAGDTSDMRLNLDLMMNQQGALITIVQPVTMTLVKTSSVQVVADVQRGGGTDIVSVQTRVAGQMKAVSMSLRGGSTTKYEAQLDLSAQRTGSVVLLVDATNTKSITNTAQVTVTYDAGPVIAIREPSGMSYRGSAPAVVDARGESTIQGGTLKELKASVQGVLLKLNLDKASDFIWTGTGTIGFTAAEFPVPLQGTQVLRVEATNNNGVTTSLERPFTIDEDGPEIELVSPKAGQIVGGVVSMVVKVTDLSSVDDNSVVAVWLNDATKFQVAMSRIPGTDSFTARFDTRRLPEPLNLIYPSLSYRARDRLGNQSSRGEVLILDNTPPVMALDPPKTQVATKDDKAPGGFKCSYPFNPVGTHGSLLKDKTVLGQVVTARARIVERGNIAQGLAIENLSGVDPGSIDLLATPFSLGGTDSPPLVVDSDGKGGCNNLNPLLMPTSAMTASNQALVLRMVNITAGGSPYYSDDFNRGLFPGIAGTPCGKSPGGTDVPPDPLCAVLTDSEPDFYFAITGEIWTIGPVDNRECAGLQLDSLNVLPQGPYCVAVRGADLAGNRNISRPVRICIERPLGSGACNAFRTAAMGNTLPSCLGRFDPATQMATTGAGQQCTLEPTAPFPRPREPYRL